MKDKIVLITGASSGIGYHIAKALYEDGFTVLGCSRGYPKQSYAWDHHLCDLANEAEIVALMKGIKDRHDKLDVLVNCAGIGIGGAIEDTSHREAQKILQINLLAPFLVSQLALPLLRRSVKGSIINIGSVAGDIAIPFQAFYSMSKAALKSFSEALRLELKPQNIDVSIILPGDTKTEFTEHRTNNIAINSLYTDRALRSLDKMAKDEKKGMSPQSVVRVVKRQLKRKKMKSVVTVGIQYKLIILLNKILPQKLKEAIIYRMYAK